MKIQTFEELEKTVRVTDPYNWYDEDTVYVSLHVFSPRDGWTKIRVSVLSIDDFAVFYDYDCESKYEDQINGMYNHIKEYMFDKMPNKISLEWLYEHGFFPD